MKKIIILLILLFLIGCSAPEPAVNDSDDSVAVEEIDGKTVKTTVTKRTYTKTEEMTPEKMAQRVILDFSKGDLTFIRDNMVNEYGLKTTLPDYEETVEAFKEECGPNGECLEVESVVVVSKMIATNLDEILDEDSLIEEYYEIEVKAIGEPKNEMAESFFDPMPIPVVKVGDKYYYSEEVFFNADLEEFH